MYYNQFINHEFVDYLNRHCTGIILLKDKIRKIKVSFHLSEAYSNHACRFCIDVNMLDYKNFSKEDQNLAVKYLYNSNNETGSQFVSFIYKPQQDYNINVEIVESFIYHYEFARNLFDGFIRNLLPENCSLEIETLETEPFFNYITSFLRDIKDTNTIKSFSKKYFEINKRDFEFDCHYHKVLKEAAVQTLNAYPIVSDKELYETSSGNIADLRYFVVKHNIPFSYCSYSDVIDEIQIDAIALKNKMDHYIAEPYVNITPKAILKLIEKKEDDKLFAIRQLEELSKVAGIEIGDYICVENASYTNTQHVGIIKNIELSYENGLRITYNIIKNDLTESRLPLQEIYNSNKVDFCILKQKMVSEKIQNGLLQTKKQLAIAFKNNGVKNSLLKNKRKKI
jgi:hypothetical protein